MGYHTHVPEVWRELRAREQAEARETKRAAIAIERAKTEQLTRALLISWKAIATIGKVVFVALTAVAMLAGAFARGSSSGRRRHRR